MLTTYKRNSILIQRTKTQAGGHFPNQRDYRINPFLNVIIRR